MNFLRARFWSRREKVVSREYTRIQSLRFPSGRVKVLFFNESETIKWLGDLLYLAGNANGLQQRYSLYYFTYCS